MSLFEVSVQGKTIAIGKVGAIEGWKMVHRLTKHLSPILDGLARGEIGKALGQAMSSMSGDEMIALLRDLTANVLVDGKKFNDTDLADYGFTILVIVEVIKHNYAGFFLPILKGLKDTSDQAKDIV
jgi:hypothetical protein